MPTPPLTVQPNGIINTVRRAVENTVNTRGDHTVAPTIAYNGESTRQGSVPFARGGDTLVAAAVLTTRTAVWVNITSTRNPVRATGRMTLMTGQQRPCTSLTVGLCGKHQTINTLACEMSWVARRSSGQ